MLPFSVPSEKSYKENQILTWQPVCLILGECRCASWTNLLLVVFRATRAPVYSHIWSMVSEGNLNKWSATSNFSGFQFRSQNCSPGSSLPTLAVSVPTWAAKFAESLLQPPSPAAEAQPPRPRAACALLQGLQVGDPAPWPC